MRVLAGLCAVLTASALLVPGAATAQTDVERTYKVWDWNIAGHTWNKGRTDTGVIEHAVDSIMNQQPDFASFNEICFDQYRAIQTQLAARGWPDTGDYSRFAATRSAEPGLCSGDDDFGQAVFSKQDLGNSRQYELPADGYEGTKKLLCAPLAARPTMKFCTVHITTRTLPPVGAPEGSTPAKTLQLNYLLSLLNNFHAAGETYLVAGDFNAQPHYDVLNRYYAPSVNTPYNTNNTGAHRELDDTDPRCLGYGEFTADVEPPTLSPCGGWWKVDMIMARESRIVGSYEGDSFQVPTDCDIPTPCSDHRVYSGTVTLRVTG